MFSRRAQRHRSVTALAAQLDRARARGGLIDLSESNPTRAGLSYPWEEIAAALAEADARGARYDPEPFGLPSAREAVAAATGADPQDVVLTASTSEAYAFLLKLLCDPDDRVLTFRPGYPLVELLAEWESVAADQVELHREAGWAIDTSSLHLHLQPTTRAILAVSPANPTGQYLKRHELQALDALAAAHAAALIADEVFAEYPRTPPAPSTADQVRRLAAEPTRSLAFSLSGLSKSCGLPQLKLSWMVLSGPPLLKAEARERLELLADLFLSAATPVQLALPALLRLGAGIRAQIHSRLLANLRALEAARPADASWSILPAEAGWSAVLRLPSHPGAEERARQLLDAGVWAQPGYLFDFNPGSGEYLVLSLLPEPAAFAEGVARLAAVLSPG